MKKIFSYSVLVFALASLAGSHNPPNGNPLIRYPISEQITLDGYLKSCAQVGCNLSSFGQDYQNQFCDSKTVEEVAQLSATGGTLFNVTIAKRETGEQEVIWNGQSVGTEEASMLGYGQTTAVANQSGIHFNFNFWGHVHRATKLVYAIVCSLANPPAVIKACAFTSTSTIQTMNAPFIVDASPNSPGVKVNVSASIQPIIDCDTFDFEFQPILSFAIQSIDGGNFDKSWTLTAPLEISSRTPESVSVNEDFIIPPGNYSLVATFKDSRDGHSTASCPHVTAELTCIYQNAFAEIQLEFKP